MNAKAVVLASATLSAATLASCGQPKTVAAQQAPPPADTSDPGYRAAPQVGGVTLAADGAVTLSGRALPSSQVRMDSPGAHIEAPTNGSGIWSASMGPVTEPALYSLTQAAGGQTVEAGGYVAVLPGAPTVALLRAGLGAEVVQASGKGALKILAVDYDAAGAAVVSGRASGPSPVRVLVDGQVLVEGSAGPDGRFSLTLSKPLPTGGHRLQAVTPKAEADAEVVVTPPAPPKGAPYQAHTQSFGWRVDWITPGGGAQATLLLAG